MIVSFTFKKGFHAKYRESQRMLDKSRSIGGGNPELSPQSLLLISIEFRMQLGLLGNSRFSHELMELRPILIDEIIKISLITVARIMKINEEDYRCRYAMFLVT